LTLSRLCTRSSLALLLLLLLLLLLRLLLLPVCPFKSSSRSSASRSTTSLLFLPVYRLRLPLPLLLLLPVPVCRLACCSPQSSSNKAGQAATTTASSIPATTPTTPRSPAQQVCPHLIRCAHASSCCLPLPGPRLGPATGAEVELASVPTSIAAAACRAVVTVGPFIWPEVIQVEVFCCVTLLACRWLLLLSGLELLRLLRSSSSSSRLRLS
jgi:hypothetical protein